MKREIGFGKMESRFMDKKSMCTVRERGMFCFVPLWAVGRGIIPVVQTANYQP